MTNRIPQLEQMLAQSPKDCFLLHALALEHIKINEIEKGISLFKKVIDINENYIGSYYHLAKSFEKIGDEQNAIFYYKKGIQIAMILKDDHAKNELQMALDEIEDL